MTRRTTKSGLYISLPAISSNKRIPLGAYVRGIKLAKARPDHEFKHGLTTWWPTTGREIVEQFLEGVHDRITNGRP